MVVLVNVMYHRLHKSSSVTPGNSPFPKTTPTTVEPAPTTSDMVVLGIGQQGGAMASGQTVDETHQWLVDNRFGQFCSMFSSYTNMDLMRLSRKDLVELCGQADGIRLFNTLRNTSLKTLYVLLPGEKGEQSSVVCHMTHVTCSLVSQHVLVFTLCESFTS